MSFRERFQHRDALLAAALEAFVASGFEGASLSAILSAAGMSKGQFYHHFRDKEDLYLGVCEVMIDRKRAFFESRPAPASADPFEALAELLRAGLAFARENPDLDAFGRAFLRERGRPIFAAALKRFSVGESPGLRELLARGLAAGSFHAGFSPAFVARAVSVVLAAQADLLDAGTPEQLESGIDQLITFLRRGLGADDKRQAR